MSLLLGWKLKSERSAKVANGRVDTRETKQAILQFRIEDIVHHNDDDDDIVQTKIAWTKPTKLEDAIASRLKIELFGVLV